MGKQSSFLEQFTVLAASKNGVVDRTRVSCVFCHAAAERNGIPVSEIHSFQRREARARAHLSKCKYALADPLFVSTLKDDGTDVSILSTAAAASSSQLANLPKRRFDMDLTVTYATPQKKQKQSTLDGCVQLSRPTADWIWGFRQKVADFIVGAGLPTTVIDCPEFRELLSYGNLLLQRYPDILPHYTAFSTTILDPQIALCVVNSNVITLCGDLWTNSSGASIFAVISHNENGDSHIIESRDVSEEIHETLVLMTQLESAIGHPLLKGKVKVVITNSTSSRDLVNARLELSKKRPDILFLPCFADQINLIMGQMLNSLDNFWRYLKLCRDLVKVVNSNSSRVKLLHRFQRDENEPVLKLLNYCDTRWSSVKDMLDIIISSKKSILALFDVLSYSRVHSCAATEPTEIRRILNIHETVKNNDFWKCIRQAQGIISVVATQQISLNSDSARLHMVLPALFAVLQQVRVIQPPLLDVKQFEQKINRRLQGDSWNIEILVLATFLVPNQEFEVERIIQADACDLSLILTYCMKYYEMFFNEYPKTLAAEVSKFYNREKLRSVEPFVSIYDGTFGNSIDTLFWASAAKEKLPELSKLANYIFSISINSSSVERIFAELSVPKRKGSKGKKQSPKNDRVFISNLMAAQREETIEIDDHRDELDDSTTRVTVDRLFNLSRVGGVLFNSPSTRSSGARF